MKFEIQCGVYAFLNWENLIEKHVNWFCLLDKKTNRIFKTYAFKENQKKVYAKTIFSRI